MNTADPRFRPGTNPAPWVPLTTSLFCLLRQPRLLGWSLVLVVLTGTLTWLGFSFSVGWVDQLTG